jgi:hypothetical protein
LFEQFVNSRTLSGLTINAVGVFVLNPYPTSRAAPDADRLDAHRDVDGADDEDDDDNGRVLVVYEIAPSSGSKLVTLRRCGDAVTRNVIDVRVVLAMLSLTTSVKCPLK